jgi:hypothetical protein
MKIEKKNNFLKITILSLIFVFLMSINSLYVLADAKDIMLFDDYNRTDLGVTGNGGAYNTPNSAGIAIYWIQMANTRAQIENSALKVSMDANGWFGEGAAIKDPAFKYIIMKIKGEKGGEEKFLSINPDAKGLKKFTELQGIDGKPVPAITKDYQNIVIDIGKSGLPIADGFEAIHFNNTEAITVYIDEIYLSKDGIPVDVNKTLDHTSSTNSSAVKTDSTDTTSTEKTTTDVTTTEKAATDTTSANNSTVSTDTPKTAVDEPVSNTIDNIKDSSSTKITSNKKPILVGGILLIMAVAIGGVLYNSYIKKANSEK